MGANESLAFGLIFVRREGLSSFFGRRVRTPWILERRDGLSCGMYYLLIARSRYSGRQAFAGAQWRLNAMIRAAGFSDSQLRFGPNPADLHR